MQLHNSLACRSAQPLSSRPTGISAASSRLRCLVAFARSRRTSPEPQDEEHVTTAEAVPEQAVPLVRSNRRAASSRRNARGASLRTVVSPMQTLRDKGILDVDDAGQTFVNVACLGEGKPHWYAISLIENKEDAYIQLLTTKLADAGYTVATDSFVPPQPPTATEAIAKAIAEKEAAADQALAKAEDAEEFLQEARGGPAEAAAAARLAEQQAEAVAAQKALDAVRTALDAAAAAAEASAERLQQYDLVVWKPRKKMSVYSSNTDQLVEREVAFSRGTGNATLLLHCTLDPTLADAVASTYYFLDWRNHQPVSAVLLNQHDLLPEEAELDEVFKLPEPCAEAYLLQVANWQHTPESEDLEAERKEYYGSGSGSPFGARPERGTAARSDPNNPSRWSVSAGPTNAGAAALIAAGEPLPWEEEQQMQQQGYGRGRGRGGRGAGRGARGGGRGTDRHPWQQQEQYGQAPHPQYATAQYPKQQQGYRDNQGKFGGYNGSWDAPGSGTGRGRGRGRGDSRQQQGRQQQWQPPQQQWGVAGAAAGSWDDGGDMLPSAEGSFSEENRQRQMDWMGDMGGSRYRDDDGFDDDDFGSSGYSGANSRRWQQQQQQPQGQQQWRQKQPTAGGDGGTTRMRQLDFTGDMGSDRYSDDEDKSNYDRLEGLDGTRQQQEWRGQQQQQQKRQQPRSAGGGRDGGATMSRQLNFMADMGSDRYSDDEDDADVGALGGSRSSSGNFSSLLSEVADAFDYMKEDAFPPSFSGPTARNNAAGAVQGFGAAGNQGYASNPGKASYMDEDTMEWGVGAGDDVSMGVDEGAAAAQSLLQEWQSEGQAGLKPYNAPPSTRSQEGLGASFEFDIDAGPGLASADSLLRQLPDLGQDVWADPAAAAAAAAPQQQQQLQPEPAPEPPAAKRKGRAATSSRRSKKTEEVEAGDAATASATGRGRKASGRKGAGSTAMRQGAAGNDVPLEGWVGGADASDEGFEEGWADRVMDDGNDRVGIDDVMRS